MAWVIKEDGEAVNLNQVTHLWIDEGTGAGHNGVAVLKASEPGFQEDEKGEVMHPMIHDLCVVLGDSEEAKPLIPALLVEARGVPYVDIADVVESVGLELWKHMDHHP